MGMSKQRVIATSIMASATGCILIAYITLRLTVKTCDAPPYLDTFDPDQYTGRWYEMARNADMPFEFGDCGTADYAILPNGLVDVTNTEWLLDGTPPAYNVALAKAPIN